METTALTTQEQNNLLQLARAQVSGSKPQQFHTLKMRNAKNPTAAVNKGEFYTVRTIGEKEELTPVGPNPRIVILLRRYSYSYFNKETEKLAAFTNELDNFSASQKVHLSLIDDKGEKTVKTFTYPDFKAWKQSDAEIGQKLTFKNVMYVVLGDPKPENVHRLFVSNASVTGVKDGEKTGDYKHPLPGSFVEFAKMFEFSGTAYCESICELGSQWLDLNEYYLTTFKAIEDNPQRDEALILLRDLLKELNGRYASEYGTEILEEAVAASPEVVESHGAVVDPAKVWLTRI